MQLTRHQAASTFNATMALDDPSNPGAAFWGSAAPIPATIAATNDASGSTTGNVSGLVQLIIGQIDQVSVDFHDRKVYVHGLDRTAEMIQTRSDQKWPSATPTSIVEDIAGRHGLNPIVDSTSDQAGKTYDSQEYAHLSDYENEWDVLTSLAEREGKVVYVSGNDLHFTKPGNTTGSSYDVTYEPPVLNTSPVSGHTNASGAGFVTLKCARDVEISGGADAKAVTTFPGQKTSYSGQSPISGGGSGVEFFSRVAGVTQSQVQAQAKSTATLANSYLKQVEIEAPGDVNVNPTMTLTLAGTGTDWDGSYFIDSVNHSFGFDHGYTMRVEAKNQDSEAQ